MKRLLLCAIPVAALGAALLAPDWRQFDLREIKLDSEMDAEMVEQIRVATHDFGGSILKLDLEAVRERLDAIPNVRSSKVSREFPDRLSVEIEEHEQLARWAPGGLVNIQGEIYSGASAQWLPIFDGPSSRLSEMSEYHFYVKRMLGSLGIGMQLVQLRVSDHGEWRVFLNNGWVLNLGSQDIHSRLKRFVDGYAGITDNFAEVAYVDLRYPNGMAIRGELEPNNPKQESKQ